MAKGFGPEKPKKGHNKRQRAYLKLIFELLQCPSGNEAKILMVHQKLIDAGLVKTIGMVAMMLAKEGDRQSANFLINLANYLADELGLSGNAVVFPQFILQMMLAIARSNSNPEAAHPILQAYLEQDHLFIERFRSWATAMQYDAEPEQALSYAAVLATFGSVVVELPLGDHAENVEAAIACHQTALQVITRDANPELWGDVQNKLAIAYGQRIKGDLAENLESAIDACKKALQVLTCEALPEEWGRIQNNLGNAYRDRIWGDKAENLERAIAAHQNALQVRSRDANPEKWVQTQMNLGADYRQRIEGDKAENLEIAIACYQQALQVYTRQAFPKDWAGVHNNLGNAYRERIFGDKSENLNKAIAAFKASLQVFNRQSLPHEWSLTQMNLGNAYREQEKIPEAITCYRAALGIWTPNDFPHDCLQAGAYMGYTAFKAELWLEAIEGFKAGIKAGEKILAWADSESRRQEILVQVIDIYEKLVKACVNNGQLGLAMEYAKCSGSQRLVNQLVNHESERNDEVVGFLRQVLWKSAESAGDTKVVYPLLEANLDKLDTQFPKVLRHLGEYIQSKVEPEQFAHLEQFAQLSQQLKITDSSAVETELSFTEEIQMAVGMLTFSLLMLKFPRGNRATNIEIAISGYEVLVPVFTHESCPRTWGEIQVHLGIAYKKRICGDRGSNLEKAIACYRNALEVFTPDTFTELWADTQNNLAIAYSKRVQGDRVQNLEQAIECCETVLQICIRNTFPEQWAHTQTNLGNFYRVRVCGEQAENLELAIRCYQDAMLVYTHEAFPQDWARLQGCIGVAYMNRIKGDPAENLEEAINYFKEALPIRTCEDFPVDWVRCQTNLGNAYKIRIFGDKAENLELAIYYYKTALKIATLESMPEEWTMAQLNLASAYSDRLKGNQAENVNSAIDAYKSASQVYTKRAYPQNWATLQNNLGILYGKQGLLEQEIHCLQASLEVCTRDAFPQDWANTQQNLGLAYCKLGLNEEAIACFRLSLEIFKPTAFPKDCLITGRDLGNTAFKVGRWKEAIEGYSLAIDAVETSRTWVTSESRRQEILVEGIDVYEKMVQACINNGQLDKAIETVERSRSKRLVDLMASNDLYQGGEIPSEVKELLQQFDNLQQRIDQHRSQNSSGNNNRELMGVVSKTHVSEASPKENRAAFQAYNEAIATLEAEKQQIWEQLRRFDPVLAGEIQISAPSFCAMQQLINSPTTAILSFYTTSNDTHVFVLRQNQITCHTCTGQGIKTLQSWIFQNWLKPYREERASWKSQISTFLVELAQCLLLSNLISQHLDGITELIIVPHLLLHQVPFTALPIQDIQHLYLGEKFLIRYTPSCQVLEFCQQRGEVGEELAYGTVEDATNDLLCASFEGEQIAQLHQIPNHRRLRGSRQATRDNYRQLAEKVQVLHSCHHGESCLDRPLDSKLKLGDGSITLGQLMTPSWRLPNLSDVFLSCCETGLGLPEITDDLLTLSTGFLCAGARSVVSTLWAVSDLATALFSIFYYQHRQQGKSRPEALQQAQIQLRELKKDELLNREDIQELKKQATVERKEAKRKRDRYQPDSGDYLEWDREYGKYAVMIEIIGKIKNSPDEEPFSHPFYWAAFTCQGLR